jgi:hypothetical protein
MALAHLMADQQSQRVVQWIGTGLMRFQKLKPGKV